MEKAALQQLALQVEQIARKDGELIRAIKRPEVFTKEGHANFVTEADLASQGFLMEELHKILPEAGFLAEEGERFSAVKDGGAFLNGRPIHAADTSLSESLLVFGSSPYYRELLDPTFAVVKKVFSQCGDIRRSGSAALDLCDVAAGRFDGFFEARLSPWDYAASSVVIREAGGQIFSGRMGLSYERPCPICAGSGALFPKILEAAESEGIF